jgi:3',5'-cyclic AMP phosphodiesterase CpdA
MRTIVHISDLHFGRHNDQVVAGLISLIKTVRPDLVVISGDFTQRARVEEFSISRELVLSMPAPVIAVPGNHDVPLYDLAARFFSPLGRYRQFIEKNLQPSFTDDEIAVVGINTARSITFKNGRINERQIEACCQYFSTAPASALRMVVTHHPFDLPEAGSRHALVGRASMAIRAFANCGADLILSGHLHVRHTSSSVERYGADGQSILLVQAGTATSTRQRGEFNSCNILRIDIPRIEIEWVTWDSSVHSFSTSAVDSFVRGEGGFHKKMPDISV